MTVLARKFCMRSFALMAVFTGMSSVGFANSAYEPLSSTLVAVPLDADVGAAERVAAATRIRTLAQQVPAAACHLKSGINHREARAVLKEARKTFPVLRDALLEGSYDLRIKGGVKRAKTIAGITAASGAWSPIDEAAGKLLDAAQHPLAHETIADRSTDMAEKTSQSLALVTAEAAQPSELLFTDALLISIAGRQGLLSQQLSLEFCQLWSGDLSANAVERIEHTIKKFEANLSALRHGDPDIGLQAVATPQMRALLDEVQSGWEDVLPAIEAVIAYGEASESVKTVVYDGLNAEMYRLERLVKLCVLYAKHHYG